MESLVSEYLSVTGRPAATLSVEEFVYLKNAQAAVSPSLGNTIVHPQPAVQATEKAEEIKQTAPLPKTEPVRTSMPTPVMKPVTIPSAGALDLLKRIPG